eukprot:CAMPEP_0197700472 /NCGR_PEP_ID=MMETSP1338-20131121/122017_1 /TAXON_ID=43686 ORGANISM="Pelagodinium beii, Strain RCC1491" /NCGR_SAMPLE_ID=MMETSP1338 /ASSEMBLY_ACC=CAM_ASM_000754 /LENGTH=79 /DNA_ID=CAMNT_0043284085 /DNA_START=18 /DNA_END=254 /DNA_ORIENTATION=+
MSNPDAAWEPPGPDALSFLTGATLSSCVNTAGAFAMLVLFSLGILFPGGVESTGCLSEHAHDGQQHKCFMGLSYLTYSY